MALTLETLLAPVSDDNPVGEDLSYDNDRAALEQAFQVEDSAEGDAAAEPDWRGVLKLIETQSARSKDLWLAVYLARAGAGSGALATVELGAQMLAGLMETYWDKVHPQLEELGVPGRKAPCDSLVSRRAFLGPLEKATLIDHPRLGRFSGGDLERFRTGGGGEDGYGLFRAALEELGPESLQEALGKLDSIADGLRRADKAFMAGAPGEDSTNFQPAYALISQMQGAVRSFLPQEEEDDAGQVDEDGGPAAATAGQRSVSGAVNSREDVLRVLDLVAAYYRKSEPSHPMPLMIERVKLWVAMDYMNLLKDIAPDAISQAGSLLKVEMED